MQISMKTSAISTTEPDRRKSLLALKRRFSYSNMSDQVSAVVVQDQENESAPIIIQFEEAESEDEVTIQTVTEPEEANEASFKSGSGEEHDDEEDKQAAQRLLGRWSDHQTNMLVQSAKKYREGLDGQFNAPTWIKIVEDVNQHGTPKTFLQVKKKFKNQKRRYKDLKIKYLQGRSVRNTLQTYETYDEMFGKEIERLYTQTLVKEEHQESQASNADKTVYLGKINFTPLNGDDQPADNASPTKAIEKRSNKRAVSSNVSQAETKWDEPTNKQARKVSKVALVNQVVESLQQMQTTQTHLIRELISGLQNLEEETRRTMNDVTMLLLDSLE